MDPLAAYAVDPMLAAAAPAPAIPVEWIQSGAVTPVVASPAATTATAWVPQPVSYAPEPTLSGSLMDAIASAMLGSGPGVGEAPTLANSPGDAASIGQQLTMQATAAPPAASAAPPAAAPALAPSPAPAPALVAHPAPTAVAAPKADPTLISSASGALAGYASATGTAASRAVGVAGSGVSKARRVGNELWAGVRSPRSIHVTQVPSKYNTAPAAGNRDCGPASVVMTLRLLGKSIPGVAASVAPQRMIDRVRELAGNVTSSASTTNHELARALTAAGTTSREIADAASIKSAVLAGKPVILNGNPRAAGSYGPSFSSAEMMPYDGAHWVVVSGFDSKVGKFIVNDPLSKVGPVKVTPAQLEAYRGGSLGIEVHS